MPIMLRGDPVDHALPKWQKPPSEYDPVNGRIDPLLNGGRPQGWPSGYQGGQGRPALREPLRNMPTSWDVEIMTDVELAARDMALRCRTRDTSIAAYNELRDSGQLTERRREIYELLYEHGPATSGEIFEIQVRESKVKALTQSRARFTELREHGVIQELGTAFCRITGREVILWDVTSASEAKPLTRSFSKSQQLTELLEGVAEALRETSGLNTKQCEEWSERILYRMAVIKEG